MITTLPRVAAGVRTASSGGDKDTALRWVIQFVDEFRTASAEARAAAVKDEPPSTGSLEWDSLIGGLVEWLSREYGLVTPAWSAAPGRFLDHWWFLPDKASLRAIVFAETPAALANRGVFVSRTAFESV